MGKQLNMIGKTAARKTGEVRGIGYSGQVGVYENQKQRSRRHRKPAAPLRMGGI